MSPVLAGTRLFLVSLSVLATIGCAQTGDFGRVRQTPSALTSLLSPSNATNSKILVLTTQELNMRNQVSRFASLSQNMTGFGAAVRNISLQLGRSPKTDDYYQWQRKQIFASSRARYFETINDVEIDLATLPELFLSVCAVNEIDRRRQIAVDGLSLADPIAVAAVNTRGAENAQIVTNFVAALTFRQQSYAFALERLLVDAPYEEARILDAKISDLSARLVVARAGQFCGQSSGSAVEL